MNQLTKTTAKEILRQYGLDVIGGNKTPERYRRESLTQLHQRLLEVIGEDLLLDTEPNTGQRIHIQVKKEIRERLEQFMGMEGEE